MILTGTFVPLTGLSYAASKCLMTCWTQSVLGEPAELQQNESFVVKSVVKCKITFTIWLE